MVQRMDQMLPIVPDDSAAVGGISSSFSSEIVDQSTVVASITDMRLGVQELQDVRQNSIAVRRAGPGALHERRARAGSS
jgi:hypothetical protein